ncbi:hypothetical protein CRG98_020433 [Punica granatum]|uniref:Aminoacyl-tRNA synthetase class II (D/K/N) domain-containing protein n=1 Tax=Punica granatum TaxID=22663 RepID=A0A2I0JS82_PUNGR|nr:hypothetical protein CRG98_020433 [Punica granatum]
MAAFEAAESSSPRPKPNPLAPFKYSKRVLLKTLLERGDGGAEFIGERVVIGGWVKSSREEKIEPPRAPPTPQDQAGPAEEQKDVSCVEILQTRIPFFRSIVKVFGGINYTVRPKLEGPAVPPKLLPSTAYLRVSDGSCVPSLLVVVDSSLASPSQLLPTGTCILVQGVLRQSSNPGKHAVELEADKVLHIGTVDQSSYVFSKKRLPLDMLRSCLHFRPRTTTVGSVMRLRSSLTFATHTFFQNHGFLNVQVPIITSTDSEGSSEKFLITAISSRDSEKEDQKFTKEKDNISLDVVKAAVKEKSALVTTSAMLRTGKGLGPPVDDPDSTTQGCRHPRRMLKTSRVLSRSPIGSPAPKSIGISNSRSQLIWGQGFPIGDPNPTSMVVGFSVGAGDIGAGIGVSPIPSLFLNFRTKLKKVKGLKVIMAKKV